MQQREKLKMVQSTFFRCWFASLFASRQADQKGQTIFVLFFVDFYWLSRFISTPKILWFKHKAVWIVLSNIKN